MMWFTQKGGALVCIKVPRNKHSVLFHKSENIFFHYCCLFKISHKSCIFG